MLLQSYLSNTCIAASDRINPQEPECIVYRYTVFRCVYLPLLY